MLKSHLQLAEDLDNALTSWEFSISMALLLGVNVYDELCICKLCGMVSDRKGIHALSCMAGGDVVLQHNAVQDKL